MIGAEAVTELLVLTVPYEIAWHGDTPMVVMAEIGRGKIDTTFWDVAIKGHAKRTAVIKLDDVVLDGSDDRFTGAIHHITRCGSTTLLQQFGALNRTFALSEPFIFLELLGRSTADPSKLAMRVQKLACLFGQALAPVADQIVVKWPTLLCRHALVLNAALPRVPSVLIVRSAIEILASIEARPLGNMDAIAPELFHGPNDARGTSVPDVSLEKAARLLAANCRWIAQSGTTRIVDYTQLPDVGWREVALAFGLSLNADQIAKMAQLATINAKRPAVSFASDSAEKRRDASAPAHSLAERILQPAIDEARSALKSF